MTTGNLSDIEESDYVQSEDTGEVYRVIALDVEFGPDGIPSGSITLTDGGATFTHDAEEVDRELTNSVLTIVDEGVVNHAEEILIEFAEQEIGNYLQRLGWSHDYNGIDQVDTLRDIKAAAYLYRQNQP